MAIIVPTDDLRRCFFFSVSSSRCCRWRRRMQMATMAAASAPDTSPGKNPAVMAFAGNSGHFCVRVVILAGVLVNSDVGEGSDSVTMEIEDMEVGSSVDEGELEVDLRVVVVGEEEEVDVSSSSVDDDVDKVFEGGSSMEHLFPS